MKLTLTIILLFISSNTYAASWISTSGTVENIITYAHPETILVDLSTDGTNVGECSNKKTFAISKSMSTEGRARMYAMLLSAQATGRVVTISFLDVDGCEPWFSTLNVYRKITIIK